MEIEFHTRKDGSMVATVSFGNHGITMDVDEWKKTAAQILRAMPSEKRAKASRENGRKGGRPKKIQE